MATLWLLVLRIRLIAAVAGVLFAVLAIGLVLHFVFFSIEYPPSLPRIGEPAGRRYFSWRTRWRYMTDCQRLFQEAYENFSKRGKTVLVPGLGFRNETILPQSAMKWMLAQPDTSLSVPHALVELNQAGYALGDDKYIADAWTGHIVRTSMNQTLERICGDMYDELGYAFDTRFGTDEDNWREIDLFATMRLVIAQAAGRFTVGLPLCRNEQYLMDNINIGDNLIANGGIAGGTPASLRPFIGPLYPLVFIKPKIRNIEKHFKPTYLERLETLKHDPKDPNYSEPQDFLQMMMRFAQKERPDELIDFATMSRRLIVANFGSAHNTSLQSTNLVLNVLDSDAEFNTIAVLREEFSRALGKDDTAEGWTKAKVATLTRADSVARETLRLDAFGSRNLFRKVMVDGLVTEDGIPLPKGALLSMLAYPAHREADFLGEEPGKFDPFRFSRAREAAAAASGDDAEDGKLGLRNLSFVSTGPYNLPFGHGKHACPGRFLIDFELKMIMAYLLQNYDLEFPPEYEGKRPPCYHMAEAIFPPADAKVRVKRRPGTTR
ncbi:cytochrome P450 [Apiospora arundinis]|uniref:Cytochrome P450 n=1 Tax=Apiospora arundinis TaxID=335852 RepID=A0ABR2ISC1_9PEZI